METGPLAPLMATGPLRVTGPLAPPAGPGAAGLLANRSFLLLWLAHATSQIGDRIHQIAVMWWSLRLDGHLADAGWVMVASTLPLVLFAPLGGALADRHDRRIVMLTCDLARALLAGGLAVLAYWQILTLPVLLAGTALLGAFTAVFIPAAMSIVPRLVPEKDLVRAGSLQELTIQLATIVGPAIGGLLVAAVGAPLAFAVNAATFVLSAAALSQIRKGANVVRPGILAPDSPLGRSPGPAREGPPGRSPDPAPPTSGEGAMPRASTRPPWHREMTDGLRVAREKPVIGALLLAFGLTNFFSAPLLLFLPRYAELFGVGPRGLGILEASLAIGTLAASVVLLSRSRPIESPGFLPPACLAAIGLVMAGLGRGGTYPLFLGGLGAIGAALGAMNVTVVAYFQRTVPPERLGRFMGLLTAIVFTAPSLGFGLMGTLADTAHPGPYVTGLGAGVVAVAGGLALALLRLRGRE